MNKKMSAITVVSFLILFSMIAAVVFSAVQEKNIRMKNYKFDLEPGDRIIVIKAGSDTYIRIRPTENRQFDLKVAEGKTLSGVLTLK